MPTTPIHNIHYAAGNDIASLNQITATMASSVENALNTLQGDYPVLTFKWATSAERVAQAGMTAGDLGYQNDTNTWYSYDGTNWEQLIPTPPVQATENITTFGTGVIPGTGANTPRVTRMGSVVLLSGTFEVGAGISWSNLLTIPPAFQPPTTTIRYVGNGNGAGAQQYALRLDNGILQGAFSTALPGTGVTATLVAQWVMD